MIKRSKLISLLIVLSLVITLASYFTYISAVTDYNYTDAFAKSILFYEANWCGSDAGENRISWRDSCHTDDGSDVGLDLTGGFHDCGDHVKFGLPQTYSASTLGWAYYEFKDTFIEKGQDEYMLNISKHFCDYFMKCFPDDTTFYYQCGDGDTDHSYWGPPEMQKTDRPTYYVANPETPGSDVAGNASASLALMYLNYKDIDSEYAEKCLDYAKRIYAFGQNYRGNSFGQNYYRPNSYYDELMWGAIWLNIATGEENYLSDVESLMDERGIGGDNVEYYNHWAHCWDDVFTGVFLKMSQLSNKEKYKIVAQENIDYWINDLEKTPAGLGYLHQWGVLKYAASEAFTIMVYNKVYPTPEYVDFAKSQIDYILGSNPENLSYVVGFGDNYPHYPHHRAASGRLEGDPANESKNDPERHILYGALVGGPDLNDTYTDDIDDYVYTEVGLDYNAGLVGALAGMTELYGDGQSPEDTPGINPDPPEYYMEAAVTYENNQQTVINSYIHNLNFSPPDYETDLSFRYFVDLTEFYDNGYTVDDLSTGIDYTPNGAIISDLLPWDVTNHIYYAEISWSNAELYGKCQTQFKIFTQSSIVWDQSNDFSRLNLSDSMTKTENISMYKSGKLIYGTEPEGNIIPSPVETAEPTSSGTESSISQTPEENQEDYEIDYDMNSWDTGATVNITITNNSSPIDGWRLEWDFLEDQKIINLWGGKYTQEGRNISVTNENWNSQIPTGGSVTFGFNISFTNQNTTPDKIILK
ncbi:MAG: glycoside hydrolase family 9 protein [Clostridiales bacterium]